MPTRIKSIALATCAALIVALASTAVFAQQTYQAKAVRPAALTGDLLNLHNANDERDDTRAYSGKNDYVGMSITIDIGSEQNVIGVSQDHGRRSPQQYPGAYRAEVAASPSGPWFKTFEGPGNRGTSRAVWPAIRARYIRVTATAVNKLYNEEWSIGEIKAGIDPGQTARTIPAPTDTQPDRVGRKPALKNFALATDAKLDTRASSETADYAGMTFSYDLGGEYELSKVVQVHGQWAEDYPGEYKIEVSRENNESRFREVWRGRGEPNRSDARFNPVITRYVRITALRNRDNQHWWSIAELRTNRDPETVEDDDTNLRQIRAVTGTGLKNVAGLADTNNVARATTGTANYAGSFVQIDLGGSYTVRRVVQVHDPDRGDFPGRYRIEVSENGRRWDTVFEGEGERSKSSAAFEPVRVRYIRITAITNRNLQNYWSISRLKVIG
jgi:F5/8 type C domain